MTAHDNVIHPHQKLIDGISHQLKEIFEESDQGIYVYRDDTHKSCNKKFASWLGYKSTDEWSAAEGPFMETFVEDESQRILISTFRRVMEDKVGASIDVTWKKKNGGSVKASVIMVPICYEKELLALHFITKI